MKLRRTLHQVRGWWSHRNGTERLEINFQGVIAVATLAYVSVALFQWSQMKAATKQTRRAADAAKESADAEVATNRAWIVPTNGPQENPTTVELYWANAGKTPAVRLRGTAEYATQWPHEFPKGCENLARKLTARGNWWVEPAYLLPGDSFQMVLQNVPAEWNQPLKPKQIHTWLIHGCIWYTDVLTDRERTTEFCYDAIRLLSPITGKVEDTMTTCPGPPEPLIFQ